MNSSVRLAASALPGEKKYILFAGAGISKDAGIPTTWDLMLKTAGLLYAADHDAVDDVNIEEWFAESKYAQMGYAELMEGIYPNYPDQQNFLDSYLGNREIGRAHIGIAELARRGIIRAIITTNFDPYIERALEEKGLKVQVISTDEDLKNSEPLIHCKAVRIYKPHGTLGRGILRNTPKDLEELSPLMEKELIRILGEHGVMVLGYSGRDKGIQKVFQERSHNHYPLFWIDPQFPEGEIEDILKEKDYTYIPCTGAGEFIDGFFTLLGRIEQLAPTLGSGPTVLDLKYAFSSSNEPTVPLYLEYLENILQALEQTMPDFSKFDNHDDAIIAQIDEGVAISRDFIEAAMLASEYSDEEVIKKIYGFFGKLLKLYDRPDGFQGPPYMENFDGFKFLVYEMFVAFISTLIKYERWELLGDILADDLLVERERDSRWLPFADISQLIRSIDYIRDSRLKLRRVSGVGDILKEHFGQGELSRLVEHREFMEADYFLYTRTACHETSVMNMWRPQSCLWLRNVPGYIVKAESKRFLDNIIEATGVETKEDFIEGLARGDSSYRDIFPKAMFVERPLGSYDLNKIGSRR